MHSNFVNLIAVGAEKNRKFRCNQSPLAISQETVTVATKLYSQFKKTFDVKKCQLNLCKHLRTSFSMIISFRDEAV